MKDSSKIVNRLSLVGILGNILLTAFKLFAGITGHSGAMISDAVHSMSDIFATFVAYLGSRFSSRSADRAHPYGHERLECVASLILGAVLFATAVSIGFSGAESMAAAKSGSLPVPGRVALIAAVVSIVTKEAMFQYTRHYAKIMGSGVWLADAWHHRSDAMSSVGSLIGIGGAMLGFPVLDSVACVVICLCIMKVAFDILRDALKKLLDTSCPEDYEQELRGLILSQPGVVSLDMLRTRMFGSKVYVDAEISVDGELPLKEAHDIAEQVHDRVENSPLKIKHIMIHLNPSQTVQGPDRA